MADKARATFPNATVMADGRVRIPVAEFASTLIEVGGKGYLEFVPGVLEVEVLPPPEPDWQPGVIVEDHDKQTFVRTEAGRWRHALGENRTPVPPLRQLG